MVKDTRDNIDDTVSIEDKVEDQTKIKQYYGSIKESSSLIEVGYHPVSVTPKTNVSSLLRPDDVSSELETDHKETGFLYLCALSADLISFSSGVSLSWTSPILPQLDTADNPFAYQVSTTQKAWIATLLPLGAAIGPLLAGYCADRFGRKKALLTIAVPMFIGYLILAAASQVELYYFARFIIGLGVGSQFAIMPIYIGEISQYFNRGKFGCLMVLSLVLGLFYPYSIGPHLSIKIYALTCAVPLVIFLLTFSIFMPESPYYLVQIGNYHLADSVIRKLRPVGANVHKELSQINETVKKALQRKATIKDLFINQISRTALLISLGLVLLQQLASINPLLSYMKTIFEASGSTIDPNICTLIIGTVEVSSNILCIAVVEKFGRRTLLMFSAFGCSLSIFTLGTFFYLKENSFNVEPVFWLPVACLVSYNFFFSMGLGCLPWTLVGELFPTNIKGLAAAFCASSNFLISGFVTFLFPVVSEWIGIHGVFWIFAFDCILGLIYIYFVVPETKGKSLSQVQDILQRMGLGCLPWTLVGELFPTNIKGLAAAFCASSNFLISGFVTFLFLVVSEWIGIHGVFWIFAFDCILGLIYIYFVVPETKGKSLSQVQDILQRLSGFRVPTLDPSRRAVPNFGGLAASNFLISGFVTFLFPVVSEWIGIHGVFWIFAFDCILGLIYIYFVVPETKGKSLSQVQDILQRLVG